MGYRAKYASGGAEPGRRVLFWCPGCNEAHEVDVESPTGWGFNGDLERPTFTASVIVRGAGSGLPRRCHSIVADGRIQFRSDSTHGLGGKTVDLPDWPETEDAR
jgi:hypothetical protein